LKIKIRGIESITPLNGLELTITRGVLDIIYKFEVHNNKTKINCTLVNNSSEEKRISLIDLFSVEEVNEPVHINTWQSWTPFISFWEKPVIDDLIKYIDKNNHTNTYTPIPELMRMGEYPSDYFISTNHLLIGALKSKVSHPYFLWDEEKMVIRAYNELFGKPLKPKESVEIEPFVILSNDPLPTLMDNYALMVKKENDIKIKKNDTVGWCSWYHYFTEVTYEDIKKNTDIIAKIKEEDEVPYNLIQLDDGYEKDIGDWLITNDKFPDLDKVAKYIKEKGFSAGIWLAPFCASESSDLFKNNPDWFVKKRNGEYKISFVNWGKNIYSLDLSNSEVLDYLSETFKDLKKIGFDYFKIDFLFAGAMPGKRFNKKLTPIQAYNMGMTVIRKAVGHDAFILGCGAPLWPSLGYVDGMRISCDTAPYWEEYDKPFSTIGLKEALRNSITRNFMNKKLWLNDPDTIFLRNRDIELSDSERKLFAYSVAVMDSMILTSDNMELVDKENLDLLKEILKMRDGKSRTFMDGSNAVYAVGIKGGKYFNTLIEINLNERSRNKKKSVKGCKWVGLENDGERIDIPGRGYWMAKIPTEAVELDKRVVYKEDGRQVNYYTEKKDKGE